MHDTKPTLDLLALVGALAIEGILDLNYQSPTLHRARAELLAVADDDPEPPSGPGRRRHLSVVRPE